MVRQGAPGLCLEEARLLVLQHQPETQVSALTHIWGLLRSSSGQRLADTILVCPRPAPFRPAPRRATPRRPAPPRPLLGETCALVSFTFCERRRRVWEEFEFARGKARNHMEQLWMVKKMKMKRLQAQELLGHCFCVFLLLLVQFLQHKICF